MKLLLRCSLPFLVFLFATGFVSAQQVADPHFDTKVAKPAYQGNGPKVLFDEAHFNFHTVSGRYKPFADLISSDGYQVRPNKAKFAKDSLSGYDILVIANAMGAERMNEAKASNPAFTEAECEAVAEWVKSGGNMLLIADHAPMGAAAANLGRRFGVDMRNGYTRDRHPTEANRRTSILTFTRENNGLGEHPILKGREAAEIINKVTIFTGQSLKGPEGSITLLKLSDTAYDVAASDRTETTAAGRSQGLAFTFGKGRVVVLGEAGCLSAQLSGPEKRPMGMNVPGLDNKQLALNILRWLSGLLS